MNNGELTQIGDNDSGRLFYFAFDEDAPLQMTWLINLIDKLYPNFDSSELEKKDRKFNNLNKTYNNGLATELVINVSYWKNKNIKVINTQYIVQ